MMQIIRHINSFHTSNSYILARENQPGCWVIDPGDSDFVLEWLAANDKFMQGILVTHSHYDHIYGICELLEVKQGVSVYASADCVKGMQSAKLNLSEYLEMPYVVKDAAFKVVKDKETIRLWDGVDLTVRYTPGHNTESMSFQVGSHLFTGDALLPGVRVFTKFFGGNRLISQQTIKKIMTDFPTEQVIWPGHGDPCRLGECKIIL